ncbi:MAG: Diguanylate cyclase [Candidatus Woesebacteria bacterium GW2011_GWB1_39_10b]|uniref:Diguanylate cyclase n=3 Tax=Candidatus Woeseibacteriota TaxID=1752722 RepID=A0A0G0NN89_9BACT|nr:MAG: Diguanylate cyclase [Microgenomates group bacterium GW2011_GWC1_38_12]KKQ94198.1 MAG: Diguanylate cyclase [Candidatus Woesebacteria bacterium GW2011_GWB1_39_10b]KKR14261.1 MAG: Diguanylate cyclase [Candidatus Woesebacteria bacterium GW2011_GWA1_39_21b]OGM65490.1 MAG: hypothetical protein A3A52_01015 [Candidatus Woesebacteria bacterium RIFCSPLOWO2_01_FULL_39_14]
MSEELTPNEPMGFSEEQINERQEKHSLMDPREKAIMDLEKDELIRKLKLAVEIDDLTGLLNRRGFNRYLEFYEAHSERTNEELSVMLIDLDRLKEINDSYGHATGDKVIQAIANTLKIGTRDADIVAHISGDEFEILLPATNTDEAESVAERLKESLLEIINNSLLWEIPEEVPINMSIGYAQRNKDEDISKTLERAETKMYEVKRSKGADRK